MSLVLPLGDLVPRVHPTAWIAPGAVVAGDVVIGEESSVWFGSVLRGDVGHIRIGRRTNIQDISLIHMMGGVSNTEIGDDVTVGHHVTIHGALIGSGVLIGMGAVLLDNVEIGAESLIAAGSLLPPRMKVPPRSFVKGSPAKVIREVTDDEAAMGRTSASHYILNHARYRAALEETRHAPHR